MISTTPYLIRAIYEWCTDQGFTPHLLVDASEKGVVVPRHLVENDKIVLNIQASAVKNLELGDEWIVFNARFSGKAMDINVPIAAVRAIFSRENGQGCAFESATAAIPTAEDIASVPESLDGDNKRSPKKPKLKAAAIKPASKGPHLKLVD